MKQAEKQVAEKKTANSSGIWKRLEFLEDGHGNFTETAAMEINGIGCIVRMSSSYIGGLTSVFIPGVKLTADETGKIRLDRGF